MKGLSFHVALVHLSSCRVSIDVFLLIVEPGYIMLAAMFLVCIVRLFVCRKLEFFWVLYSLSSWVWFGDKHFSCLLFFFASSIRILMIHFCCFNSVYYLGLWLNFLGFIFEKDYNPESCEVRVWNFYCSSSPFVLLYCFIFGHYVLATSIMNSQLKLAMPRIGIGQNYYCSVTWIWLLRECFCFLFSLHLLGFLGVTLVCIVICLLGLLLMNSLSPNI